LVRTNLPTATGNITLLLADVTDKGAAIGSFALLGVTFHNRIAGRLAFFKTAYAFCLIV